MSEKTTWYVKQERFKRTSHFKNIITKRCLKGYNKTTTTVQKYAGQLRIPYTHFNDLLLFILANK